MSKPTPADQRLIDGAIVSILEGTAWSRADSIEVARAQGIEAGIMTLAAALPAARALPQRLGTMKHVIRDPATNQITATIEESVRIIDTEQ